MCQTRQFVNAWAISSILKKCLISIRHFYKMPEIFRQFVKCLSHYWLHGKSIICATASLLFGSGLTTNICLPDIYTYTLTHIHTHVNEYIILYTFINTNTCKQTCFFFACEQYSDNAYVVIWHINHYHSLLEIVLHEFPEILCVLHYSCVGMWTFRVQSSVLVNYLPHISLCM